ncbi:MAG: UDP-N-acetyl glucosamine 2-epimerase, partial [Candidatus Scalindua sp.]
MKLILVAGARPNFMKIAPIIRQLKIESEKLKVLSQKTNDRQLMTIDYLLVHTGQHYDYEMSKVFFEDLEIPEPDIYLGVGSGTHAEQSAKVMIEFEKVLMAEKPDIVVVVGDVNSTIACALATAKIDYGEGIRKDQRSGIEKPDICHPPSSEFCGRRPLIAHVEAGLRSYDRSMPEEINRVLTDTISDCFFTHSPDADENLRKEGIPGNKIFLVGNIMADNLLYNLEKAEKTNILEQLGLKLNPQSTIPDPCSAKHTSLGRNPKSTRPYALLTLHRPSGVDQKDAFLRIINALAEIGKNIPIIFPAHPRTRKMITEFKLQSHFLDITGNESQTRQHARSASPFGRVGQVTNNGIYLVNSFGFLDFLNLIMHSTFVMTDSGGIQEETTVLDIPCLTLRDNTERPITITQGTNVLVGTDTQKIVDEA